MRLATVTILGLRKPFAKSKRHFRLIVSHCLSSMEQEVMQAIRAELESNIDAKYREFHSSLVPGQNCRILGVRIPVSRRIAKAIARDHYEVYTEQFNPEVYEELLIRGMMIGYGKLTREEQTAELDCFVPMINSWGICDSSCATCHFMKKDQEYWYG